MSSVVRGRGSVREETRQRVRDAIDELGYRPNPLARGLDSRATDTVTLALPDLGQRLLRAAGRRGLRSSGGRGHQRRAGAPPRVTASGSWRCCAIAGASRTVCC
ncbi:LacI family DNA-binding transcriptional regulator [Streptomyces yatensis]|uniref:LacI family DNA-binding transcriptional regulator n=1 Tax=Streptomyces yatensis TaxID=155177 RepID=UPI0024847409|nr:LacI family DNA-binding transcriptional regulator [Streptomyces yatensis]